MFRQNVGLKDIEIPKSVDDSTHEYDWCFLEAVLPKLEMRDPFLGKRALLLLENFADLHSKAMIYGAFEGKWGISNYAYENLRFLSENGALRGNCYHVTGNAAFPPDGDHGDIFVFDQNRSTGVYPMWLSRNHLKGIVIAQELRNIKGHYLVSLLVGDKFPSSREIEMPRFRGRGRGIPQFFLGRGRRGERVVRSGEGRVGGG